MLISAVKTLSFTPVTVVILFLADLSEKEDSRMFTEEMRIEKLISEGIISDIK